MFTQTYYVSSHGATQLQIHPPLLLCDRQHSFRPFPFTMSVSFIFPSRGRSEGHYRRKELSDCFQLGTAGKQPGCEDIWRRSASVMQEQSQRFSWNGNHISKPPWADTTLLASCPHQALLPQLPRSDYPACAPVFALTDIPLHTCAPNHCLWLDTMGSRLQKQHHSIPCPHAWPPVAASLCPLTSEPQSIVSCLPRTWGPALAHVNQRTSLLSSDLQFYFRH